MPHFVRALKQLHSRLPERGFTELGTAVGDRHVSGNELRAHRERIGRALDAFEANQSEGNLFSLHHALDSYRAQGIGALYAAAEMLAPVEERVRQSNAVRRLRKGLSRVDFSKLYISGKNMKYLLEESRFPHGGRRDIGYEATGNARIVPTAKGFEIVPVTQSLEEHSPSTAVLDLPHLFASKSQIIWHTHPAGSPQQRTSEGDRGQSDKIGIPIMMAMDAKHAFNSLGESEPVIEVHYNGKQFRVAVK